MRVLAVTYDSGRTGAPRLLADLARSVVAHGGVEWRTLVGRAGPLSSDLGRAGPVVPVIRPRHPVAVVERGLRATGHGRVAATVRRMQLGARVRRDRPPDLVLLNGAGAITLAADLPVPAGVPRVALVHELEVGFARAVPAPVRRRAMASVAGFVAVSEPVRAMLVDGLGVAADRVSVAHGFVDTAAVAGRARRSPTASVAGRGAVVGTAGEASWRKGADRFGPLAQRVLDHLGPETTPTRFVWVGRAHGPGTVGVLDGDRHRLGVSDELRFLGEQADPVPAMAGFDVAVLLSREDALPLTVLEAGALGVPVVAMDCGGATELLRSTGGVVVPAGDVDAAADAVVELLRAPERRRALGDSLRGRVLAGHDAAEGAPRMWAAIRALAAGPGSPGRS